LVLGFHPSLCIAVIPAKAEALFNSESGSIHLRFLHQSKWVPAFAEMTAVDYELIN